MMGPMHPNKSVLVFGVSMIFFLAPRAAMAVETDGSPRAVTAVETGEAFAQVPLSAEEDAWKRGGLLDALDWTWLAASATVFMGSAAALTAFDARAMEKDLHERLEASRQRPISGSEVVDLSGRTRRRALLANVLWGLTGTGVLVSAGIFHLEVSAERPDPKDERGLRREARGVRGGSGGIGEAQGSFAARASDGPPDPNGAAHQLIVSVAPWSRAGGGLVLVWRFP